MKTADLEVGTDYAYEAWKRALPTRVTVLATGVTGRDSSGFGGRGKPTSGLVKVAYATGERKGEEANVRPQTLLKTWTQHHGEQVSRGRANAAYSRSQQAERQKRAAFAFDLHQSLVNLSASVGVEYVREREQEKT